MILLEPFAYDYMKNAMLMAGLVGGMCAFLSAYLMLKGWSLIGDALSHSVVPGWQVLICWACPLRLGPFWRADWRPWQCFSVGTVRVKN